MCNDMSAEDSVYISISPLRNYILCIINFLLILAYKTMQQNIMFIFRSTQKSERGPDLQ